MKTLYHRIDSPYNLVKKVNIMEYEDLTHEQKELVQFIQNNEQAYNAVNHTNKKGMEPIVKQCAINYWSLNCSNKDHWYDVFSGEDIKKVAQYFNAQ